jgi:5-methylcytosine-specific restriction protein A
MTEWMISANAEMYEHSSSFEHFNFIDWRQGNAKFEINDIVYIYATRPISSVRYKCQIEKINLTHSETRDDKEYWKNIEEYEKSLHGKFMRLRLIEQVSNPKLSLENLKLNGLSAAPQGPIKVKTELSEYLNKNFTDKYQIEYFPDILNEDSSEYEGLKKTITVNKYERSSIAREKCIEHNGLNCFVCNMKFEEVYGELGKGFIHIHHITPLYQIGKEYKVDYKKDLAPVCPNCHAMLHRKIDGKELSIQELKLIVKK